MSKPKLLSIATLLAFTIGVIATATALANPEILPKPTAGEPISFTYESTIQVNFKSGVNTITCQKLKNSGINQFKGPDEGEVTIDFEECKLQTGNKCKTSTDTNGTLLFTYDAFLVDILPVLNELRLGLLLSLPENVVMTCGTLLFELKGGVVGKVDGITSLVKTKTAELNFDLKEGKQEFLECDLLEVVCLEADKKTHKKFELLAKFKSEGVFQLMLLGTLKIKVAFEKEVEVHF